MKTDKDQFNERGRLFNTQIIHFILNALLMICVYLSSMPTEHSGYGKQAGKAKGVSTCLNCG